VIRQDTIAIVTMVLEINRSVWSLKIRIYIYNLRDAADMTVTIGDKYRMKRQEVTYIMARVR